MPGQAKDDDELVSLIRGICGGFLFAIPIIYTMEVWWLGYTMPLARALGFLALGYGLALGLNHFSGFREDASFPEVFGDAIVALALGVVIAAIMLVTIGVVTPATSLQVALNQIVILSVPVSIGVSLARAQLGSSEDAEEEAEDEPGWRTTLVDVGTTIIGAVFTSLAVAPTEEVITIAQQGTLWHLLATIALSLVLSYAMVFLAGFSGGSGGQKTDSPIQSPLGETLVSYVVSLLVATTLLGFLGYFQGEPSLLNVLTMIVVLGLPTTLGGAAGRLIL